MYVIMEYIIGKIPIILHVSSCFLYLPTTIKMMAMISSNPPAILIGMMILQKKNLENDIEYLTKDKTSQLSLQERALGTLLT